MAEDLSPEMKGLETSIQSKLEKIDEAIKDESAVRIPDPAELTNVRNLIKAFRREVTTELPKGTSRSDAVKRAKKYEQKASDLRGEIERRKIGVSSTQKKGEYDYDHRSEMERMADKDTHEVAQETIKVQKNTEQSLLRTLQMGAASSELAADTEQRLQEQSRQINDINQDMDDYNHSIDHMNKQLKQVWKWVPRQLQRKSNRNARELRKAQLEKKNQRLSSTKQNVDLRDGAAINAIHNAQRINTNMDGKDGDQIVAQFEENDKRTDILLKAVGDQIGTLKIQAENINNEIASQDAALDGLNNQMDKAEDTGEKISNTFQKHGFGKGAKKKKFGFF